MAATKFELNDSTPAPPGGRVNVQWQFDATGNVSGNIPTQAVTTVFGRTGAVVAQNGDYAAAQITNAVSTASSYADPPWLTALGWGKLTGVPATFPPSAHVHAGTDITSGVIAPARLGTGTPSASNYLRGDGSWATVSGGGSQTPWTSDINAANYMLYSAGKIGIGTASPGSLLEINKAGVSGPSMALNNTDTTSNNSAFAFQGRGVSQWSFSPDYSGNGGTELNVVSSSGGRSMVFLQNGNVGIGTASPGVTLDVAGSCNATSSGTGTFACTATLTNTSASAAVAAGILRVVSANSSSSNALIVCVNNASAVFQVNADGSTSIPGAITTNSNMTFAAGAVGAGAWYNGATAHLVFAGMEGTTDGVWRIYVANKNAIALNTANAYVGIYMPTGTATVAGAPLDVQGIDNVDSVLIRGASRVRYLSFKPNSPTLGDGTIMMWNNGGYGTVHVPYLTVDNSLTVSSVINGYTIPADMTSGPASSIVKISSDGHTRIGGYLFCAYVNCGADVTASNATHFAVQTGDNYIRWKAIGSAQILNMAGYGNTGDWNNDFTGTNPHTRRWTEFNAGTNQPPGGGWFFCENMRHSNTSLFYGRQIAWGWEDRAHLIYTRNISNGSFSPWYQIAVSGDFSQGGYQFRNDGNTGCLTISNSTAGANVSSGGMLFITAASVLTSHQLINIMSGGAQRFSITADGTIRMWLGGAFRTLSYSGGYVMAA